MIKYCTKCLYPDTKPDIWFNKQGICSACIAYENRPKIDWKNRENEFKLLVQKHKTHNNENYDCLIPVSGGKDSIYITIKALEYGLKPLCVTATTCSLSKIGSRNIENLKNLGVDHISLSTNPVLRRKINKFALSQIGDISWPEHLTIFTIPVQVAIQYNIKLILWGENSQNEYGGPSGTENNKFLDRKWLEEFGGLLGLRVSDLTLMDENIQQKDLLMYQYPDKEKLESSGISGVFLGYFFPWDSISNKLISQANGFETFKRTVEGHFLNCENLDNYQAGIHEYFMFLKYGYGRATAQASMQIRRGRLERKLALQIVNNLEGKYPISYLGKPLNEILSEIDLSTEEFNQLCERFTNKSIFLKNNNNELIKNSSGDLVKINYDN